MKTLVKYEKGYGNVELRDIPEPKAEAGQVKIRVEKAGICGSDIHAYKGEAVATMRYPVILGHEFSGVITEVGDGVTDLKIGDRVVSETAYETCGVCKLCKDGWYNICINKKTLGYWYNGVFAEYTVVPASRVRIIPENISFTEAAMTEPLACVVHAVYDQSCIKAGDYVMVFGPGAIGQMAAQLAKAQGAIVIVAGTNADEERMKLAKELGADYTINVQQEDPVKFAASLTDGYGVDVILECSGNAHAINTSLKCVKKRGVFTQIGLPGKKIEFDVEEICSKEIKFTGSMSSRSHSWEKALQLMEMGKVNLLPLGTIEFGMENWEKAFEAFEQKKGYKIILDPKY